VRRENKVVHVVIEHDSVRPKMSPEFLYLILIIGVDYVLMMQSLWKRITAAGLPIVLASRIM
jgi:hypothetical protein